MLKNFNIQMSNGMKGGKVLGEKRMIVILGDGVWLTFKPIIIGWV